MEWQFGYNCRHYLPTINKCRILINDYGTREDLLELKWLDTGELLTYIDLPRAELIERIRTKKIQMKPCMKSKSLKYGVRVASEYDGCFLEKNGGQCLYFAPHGDKKISCLLDLNDPSHKHPNYQNVPSEQEINDFEKEVRNLHRLTSE
jgi:hypothetical protein